MKNDALLLHPKLAGEGGIPRHGRETVAIMDHWRRLRDGRLRVLSLNDFSFVLNSGQESVNIQGFRGEKFRFVLKAMLSIMRRGPDVLIIGFAHFLTIVPFAKAFAPRARILLLIYGIEAWKRLSAFQRLGLLFVDRVVAISEYSRRRFCEANRFPLHRCSVIYCTLGNEWRTDACKLRSSGAPKTEANLTLLSVARLDASEGYKGIDSVIEALPEIHKRFPGVTHCVVGDGDDRQRLESLARERGVLQRVKFLGRVDEESLRSCYDACDVFVLPSSGEGFGLVYLEAMLFEKPVVAGAHGGAAEVVEDCVTGFLVDREDIAGLTDKICRLLGDAELRARMGAAGRARAETTFGIENIAKEWERLLDEIGIYSGARSQNSGVRMRTGRQY